jgi:hypothetical protein
MTSNGLEMTAAPGGKVTHLRIEHNGVTLCGREVRDDAEADRPTAG